MAMQGVPPTTMRPPTRSLRKSLTKSLRPVLGMLLAAALAVASLPAGASGGSPGIDAWPTSSQAQERLAALGYVFVPVMEPASDDADSWTGSRGTPDEPDAEDVVGLHGGGDAAVALRLSVHEDGRVPSLALVAGLLAMPDVVVAAIEEAAAAASSVDGGCAFKQWALAGGTATFWRRSGDGSPAIVLAPAEGLPAALLDEVPTDLEEACRADGDRVPDGPAAAVVTVVARDLAFDPAAIVVPVSGATIEFRNTGYMPHNLTVDELGLQVVAGRGGRAEVALVDPEPGTYRMYCSISGHMEAGMVGVLTVE
jgi:plastocyanin